MEILLIRHAHDTRSDIDRRPLSARGRCQASALAQRLSGVGADELWSSPANRARQTAEFLEPTLRMPARVDSRVEEIRNTRPELKAPPPRERHHEEPRDGVETWPEFLARVSSFFTEICTGNRPGRRVVVVTHRGVFDALHEVLTGADRRVELDVDHTATTAWRYRPGSRAGTWELRWHNDLGCIGPRHPMRECGIRERNW